MLSRRGFFRLAGGAAAAVAVASYVPSSLISKPAPPVQYTVGSYADYCNFSEMAVASSVDPALLAASNEMSYLLGLTLNSLVSSTIPNNGK